MFVRMCVFILHITAENYRLLPTTNDRIMKIFHGSVNYSQKSLPRVEDNFLMVGLSDISEVGFKLMSL